MRVFIPYKETKDDGLECKFTIRSMVKHFKSMTNVILIGDKPSWYKGDHHQFEDVPNRKEYSIYRKLILLNETVLHCNDDFYALQDFDKDLPNYYSGLCREQAPMDKTYRDLFRNCPGEWKNFDIHCPIVLNTQGFDEWLIDRPLKTTYANFNKLLGTETIDCKIRYKPDVNEINYNIAGRMFFSSCDNAHENGMNRVLNSLYPNKSRYER